MNRRHGDMRGVPNSIRGKHTGGHDGLCQRFCFFSGLENGQSADDRQSFLDFRGIAGRRLSDDHLRNRALKEASSIVPPFLRGLLVPRDNHVAAGASDQVADERRF